MHNINWITCGEQAGKFTCRVPGKGTYRVVSTFEWLGRKQVMASRLGT